MTKIREEGSGRQLMPAGRRCACGTILSVYNKTDTCGPCESAKPVSKRKKIVMRGRKVVST